MVAMPLRIQPPLLNLWTEGKRHRRRKVEIVARKEEGRLWEGQTRWPLLQEQDEAAKIQPKSTHKLASTHEFLNLYNSRESNDSYLKL